MDRAKKWRESVENHQLEESAFINIYSALKDEVIIGLSRTVLSVVICFNNFF